MSALLKASIGVPLEQSRMAHGALGRRPPQASPIILNRPMFKLPGYPPRIPTPSADFPARPPPRRVLGSKRLHYIVSATPARSPTMATPDGTGGPHHTNGWSPASSHTYARNLSLDLGAIDSPQLQGNPSNLITPSPMSVVATPRAPHKYFDNGNLPSGANVRGSGGSTFSKSAPPSSPLPPPSSAKSSPGRGSKLSKPSASAGSIAKPALPAPPTPAAQPKASAVLSAGGRKAVPTPLAPHKGATHSVVAALKDAGEVLSSPLVKPPDVGDAAEAPSSQAKTPRAPKRSLFDASKADCSGEEDSSSSS